MSRIGEQPITIPERVTAEGVELLDCDPSEVLRWSAKEGLGVAEILEALVHKIPPPQGDPDGPVQAMVFDSVFDTYRGAMPLVRMFNGTLNKGDRIKFFAHKNTFEADEVGSSKKK